MGELHPLGEGGTAKLLRLQKEGELSQVVMSTGSWIARRDEMIEQGEPQEQIDFFSRSIESNLSRMTEEERRLVELCAAETRKLIEQSKDHAQETEE